MGCPIVQDRPTWKEKHLDYEIETCVVFCPSNIPQVLEKKSISITRLKLCKIVDDAVRFELLEKKSISITRLKLYSVAVFKPRKTTWKEKHLDYEIETPNYHPVVNNLL